METSLIITLLLGIILGSVIVYLIFSQRDKKLESAKTEMKDAFASLSMETLERATDQFLKLANESFKGQFDKGEVTLEEKKKLIDASLKNMVGVLEDLKKRSTVLSTQLSESQKETDRLRMTTEDLRNILSSSQARGQWGERMVEDILSLVGLVENVNYVRQAEVGSGERPDYTFFLPKEKRVNMDVKFPLVHYERYIAANSDEDRKRQSKRFLDDVKGHIKDVASRGYIDPTAGTVDYVLLFIPNEGIYAFLHKSDPGLLDFALEKHIILCSPITLFAVLSLIHQSVTSFAMEEKTGQIMTLLKDFEKQWEMFVAAMDKMGRRIEDARKEFENLTSTRSRQLQKPLDKIKEIELGEDGGVNLLPESDQDEG